MLSVCLLGFPTGALLSSYSPKIFYGFMAIHKAPHPVCWLLLPLMAAAELLTKSNSLTISECSVWDGSDHCVSQQIHSNTIQSYQTHRHLILNKKCGVN